MELSSHNSYKFDLNASFMNQLWNIIWCVVSYVGRNRGNRNGFRLVERGGCKNGVMRAGGMRSYGRGTEDVGVGGMKMARGERLTRRGEGWIDGRWQGRVK